MRQVLHFNIGSLCILDSSENNLFSILEDVGSLDTHVNISQQLANIKNTRLCEKIFREFKPQIIVHAVAYKHVPIQESFPWQAIGTNVAGTRNLIDLANNYQVEKFILVSTDKAVRPYNIMGASKRVAELMVQNVAGPCKFVAVRFGNVIGSSGSVIPTFQRQIREGGPVTVTHPDITRYFMSIPEASQLILQAAAQSRESGDIYILDMGKPIRIRDMAIDLIRLSGYEPDIDIPIIYTGLRPGEKMYEELNHRDETLLSTGHPKIKLLKRSSRSIIPDLEKELATLIASAEQFDTNGIIENLLA